MKNINMFLLTIAISAAPFFSCIAMFGEGTLDLSDDKTPLSQVNLKGVHTLNLRGRKDIDFDELSRNKDAGNIININLEETNVNSDDLKKLLYSGTFGTKRDLPQISARYEMPSSEIYVSITNSSLPDKERREISQKPVGKFNLSYKTGETLVGIKWMKINEKD
jgi:hypothetical protein